MMLLKSILLIWALLMHYGILCIIQVVKTTKYIKDEVEINDKMNSLTLRKDVYYN